MLFADLEHQFISAFFRRLDGVQAADVNAAVSAHVEEALRLLRLEGYGDPGRHEIAVYADVKYVGQTAPLSIRLPAHPVTGDMLSAIKPRYGDLHEQVYGYRSDAEPLQFVALKVVGRGIAEVARMPERIALARESTARTATRCAWFGAELGWRETRVLPRTALSASAVAGPLIIEEYDSTTVVRPHWRAHADRWNNIVLQREPTP
jgi:N-methylhydantoinase A